MDGFDKEFITQMFLDSDHVSTVNRLTVAIANVVTEHSENIIVFNEALEKDFGQVLQAVDSGIDSCPDSLKVNGYYENIVRSFDNEDYLARFKMKKSTVQALINFLKENIERNTVVPLDKKVHIFLWLLTSDCSFNEVATLFGLQKATVSYIFHKMALLICEQRYNFISWPSIEEQHVTRIKVNSRYKFPNCVGFIDACHFKVGAKHRTKGKQDTVLLQAVCDESLMFIDIHIGDIGRTKKNKVFKDSSLAQEIKNFIDFENHILGDAEYKLRKNLMTPFSSEELLTSEEMKFNEVHWKARSYIGHAFELLKERFRKLNYMEVVKPEVVNTLICAACVLHNFILLHEGCPEIKEEMIICDEGVTIDTNIVKTASEKRQFLCNYINYINLDNALTSPVNDL
ncbi:uncharacterized protein LOC135072198 [Ostrinia nubilalis]|uniref:uncharacterized protein LOC135072198 n=1 Tax=Ostrinia nubilalis TaxID=29057 RepID=UPI00308230C3